MATLQEYIDAAPFIMGLGEFTVNQVETKLASIPEPPADPVPPVVTKQIVIDIFNQIFSYSDVNKGVAAANGYTQLGIQHGISGAQAKTIVNELKAMLSVYAGQ